MYDCKFIRYLFVSTIFNEGAYFTVLECIICQPRQVLFLTWCNINSKKRGLCNLRLQKSDSHAAAAYKQLTWKPIAHTYSLAFQQYIACFITILWDSSLKQWADPSFTFKSQHRHHNLIPWRRYFTDCHLPYIFTTLSQHTLLTKPGSEKCWVY